MFKKKTFLGFMVAVAASFGIFATDAHAQQDFSRAYGYGGVVRAPSAGGGSGASGAQQRPILEVGSSFDAGGILGCAGLDIKGMLDNTFNVGNLGDEFKNYLQNTIATEALSLLYSQPGVSQVLDGMKAIGHARVSIQQEQCNAQEIYADATNRRITSEAHQLCLQENGNRQTECEGSKLAEYVEQITQSRRWSGTLHDHVCTDENSTLCQFLPNFAYDIGTGEGQTAQASVPAGVVSAAAEQAAMQCMEVRGQAASQLLSEVGYAQAMQLTASGQRTISCGGGAGGAPDGGAPGGGGDSDPANRGGGGSVFDAFGTVNACIATVGGQQINVESLNEALSNNDTSGYQNINPITLVQEHSKCILEREIHPHVDINIQTLPTDERAGAEMAIAQSVRTKAAVNLYNALITALSEALIRSGGSESSNADTSMNTQTREFVVAQLEAFRAARDSIQTDDELSKGVSDSVSRMTGRLDELQQRNTRAVGGAMARGSGVPFNNRSNSGYSDLFR